MNLRTDITKNAVRFLICLVYNFIEDGCDTSLQWV